MEQTTVLLLNTACDAPFKDNNSIEQMNDSFIQCGVCLKYFHRHDMARIETYDCNSKYYSCNKCLYCSHDHYFKEMAQARMRAFKIYGDDNILEMEILFAKTRFILRGEDSTYVTHKNEKDMITHVNNSQDLRQALNENLDALLTKKRKLLVVKEVNNTLGKFLSDVKMELMQNAMSGNREPIAWFDNKQKEIGEQYGVTARIKQVV